MRFSVACLAVAGALMGPALAEPSAADPLADRPGPSAGIDRRIVLAEADLAGMRQALALRGDQSEAWSGFDRAVHGVLGAFADPKMVPDAGPNPDNALAARADRMIKMADALRSRGEALKRLDAAWTGLQSSFDDKQRETGSVLGDRLIRELSFGPRAGSGPHPMPMHPRDRGPAQPPSQRM